MFADTMFHVGQCCLSVFLGLVVAAYLKLHCVCSQILICSKQNKCVHFWSVLFYEHLVVLSCVVCVIGIIC